MASFAEFDGCEFPSDVESFSPEGLAETEEAAAEATADLPGKGELSSKDGWDDDGDYSCFDPRSLRLSDKKGFDGKALPEDGTWKIYGGGADATAEKLVFDSTRPLLVVTKRVWDEVNYLIRRKSGYELAAFLVCRELFGTEEGSVKLVAEDLFFPKQEVSGSGVSVDAKDCKRIYADLAESARFKGGKLHRYLVHLHSHASFATFWSSVDTNQQSSLEDLGFYDDYRFYIVNNVSDEPRMAYVQYQPVLFRMDGLPFIVWDDGSKALSEDAERMKQLDMLLDECWKLGDTSEIWKGRLTDFGGYSTQRGAPEGGKGPASWGERRFDGYGSVRNAGYGNWDGGYGSMHGARGGYGSFGSYGAYGRCGGSFDPYDYGSLYKDDGSRLGRSWLDWDGKPEKGAGREMDGCGWEGFGKGSVGEDSVSDWDSGGNWDYDDSEYGKVYSFYDVAEVTSYTNRKYGSVAAGMFEECQAPEREDEIRRLYGVETLRAYRKLIKYALEPENKPKNVAMVAGILQSEFAGMCGLLDMDEEEFASEDNVNSLQDVLTRTAMVLALRDAGDTFNAKVLLDTLG